MLHRYIVRPRSPWGTPLRSDTLYGLLLYRLGEEQGEKALRDTLSAFRDNQPPFVLSSAMPARKLFFPKLPPASRSTFQRWVDEGRFTNATGRAATLFEVLNVYKQFRKQTHISIDSWKKYANTLSVRNLFGEYWKLRVESPTVLWDVPLSRQGTEPHVSIARNTGGALEGGLYTNTLRFFYPEAALHLYARTERPDALLNTLTSIGQLGFGKDASTGKGRFDVELDTAFDPAVFPSGGACHLLLSLCASDDMSQLDGWYGMEAKRGKAAPHIARGNPFKNPFLCVQEGAVLTSLPSGSYVLDNIHEHPDIVQVVQPLTLPCGLEEEAAHGIR